MRWTAIFDRPLGFECKPSEHAIETVKAKERGRRKHCEVKPVAARVRQKQKPGVPVARIRWIGSIPNLTHVGNAIGILVVPTIHRFRQFCGARFESHDPLSPEARNEVVAKVVQNWVIYAGPWFKHRAGTVQSFYLAVAKAAKLAMFDTIGPIRVRVAHGAAHNAPRR